MSLVLLWASALVPPEAIVQLSSLVSSLFNQAYLVSLTYFNFSLFFNHVLASKSYYLLP